VYYLIIFSCDITLVGMNCAFAPLDCPKNVYQNYPSHIFCCPPSMSNTVPDDAVNAVSLTYFTKILKLTFLTMTMHVFDNFPLSASESMK